MFRGSFQHTIDSKGRLSVPTRFRDLVPDNGDGKQLIITAGMTGDCLWAYPLDTWQEVEKQILETKSSPAKDAFVRKFFGQAQECVVDKIGRVIIPPVLREVAGLKKEIFFLGAIQKFEIWSKDRFVAASKAEDSQRLVEDFYKNEEIWI